MIRETNTWNMDHRVEPLRFNLPPTFPSILHEITNVLVIIAIGICLDGTVMFAKEFQGVFLVQFTQGGVGKDLGRSFIFTGLVDNVTILKFQNLRFVILVNQIHDFGKRNIAAVHFQVGIKDLLKAI